MDLAGLALPRTGRMSNPAELTPEEKDRPVRVILCIDDEEKPLLLRKLVLKSAGYQVLTATNSADAIKLLQENAVDLVLTDHFLRGETGTELARHMKTLRPELPIAVLSGASETAQDAGKGDLFMSKDAGPTEMLTQIARLLKL